MESKVMENIIGVDLGQSKDFTAICVIEKTRNYKVKENLPANYNFLLHGPYKTSDKKNYFHVRHLERLPLGTSYPDVVRRVSDIQQKVDSVKIVVDYTGVGRPVFDMFKEAKLYPWGISITGGDKVTRDGRIYNVPKRDLAGVLQVLYQQERIKVASKLHQARILNDELLNFKVKIDPETGHDTYEHRSGKHDDLVLAVACACWLGEKNIGQWGWSSKG